MAQNVHAPRGMRDFTPAEKAHRERVLTSIVDTYRRNGFSQIETPVMEELSRLTSGMGGDNEKLAFRVLRRGLTDGDLVAAAASHDESALADLGLRYDLTVPLARFYATHHAELPKVLKSIQAGPVWRAERPQKGRYRQFVQCDIDIIGEPSNIAEIELIAATSSALTTLGLDSCVIRINDRRILDSLLEACGFADADRPGALISIDKLDKIGVTGVVEELDSRGFAEQSKTLDGYLRIFAEHGDFEPTAEGFAAALPGLEDALLTAPARVVSLRDALRNLEQIALATATAASGLRLVFDPTLVRGMGYYTGTIFEIALDGAGHSVGGGGRYDGMIGRFLDRDVPACGFSIGFERIVDLVDDAPQDARAGVALVYDAPGDGTDDPASVYGDLIRLKAQAIERGLMVRLERRPKKLAPLLEQLSHLGITSFAVIGDSTIDFDDLELKPLA